MISIFQAVVLGLVQGLTELFPISSLGHSVIIPQLLGWDINQNDPFFLTFLVATHLATALVLFGFFWHDWVKIFKGLRHSITKRRIDTTYAKLGWLLVAGTIPAGIIGLAFEKPLRHLFASAQIAAFFLLLNGFILLGAERLRKRANKRQAAEQSDKQVSRLSLKQAIGIGTAQAGALFPGISRSGASMAGGLLAGLDNESAARFSFLLATPIIGAAAFLKLPELFTKEAEPLRGAILIGALCAAVAAYLSVRFLVKYFQTRTLTPFAIYCMIAGAACFMFFALT